MHMIYILVWTTCCCDWWMKLFFDVVPDFLLADYIIRTYLIVCNSILVCYCSVSSLFLLHIKCYFFLMLFYLWWTNKVKNK